MKNNAADSFKNRQILKDINIVKGAATGDPAARERLAMACLPRVRKLVYLAYGSREDADDLVQIAMVHIFRDLAALRNYDKFLSWLDTVVYNSIRSHGRRRLKFSSIFVSSDVNKTVRFTTITPESENSREQLFKRIERHLEKINSKKRVAVVMSLFFGYVDSEIAKITNCSIETAKKRVQHGRKELISKISGDEECKNLLLEAVR
jgi:RNA polymerase sigma-70 factor (ECF subfamily)